MSLHPPRSHEPILNLPVAVIASLVVLVAIHALRLTLSEETDFRLILDWGVVPARWSVVFGGIRADEVVRPLQEGLPEQMAQSLLVLARYVLGDGGEGRPWTALTYGFLHGSWTHLIVNGIWLAAFGTPIAKRCGAGRFFLLSALTAIGGALLYAYVNPLQIFPMIGASAAVSGMMAAASWFMFAPAGWHPAGRVTEAHEKPREALVDMMRNRQVLIFLGVWFAANYIFAFVQPFGVEDASIAWEAHIGGFIVGLLIFPLLDPLPSRTSRISA